jgi:probable HAF family extracellular repeat protein
MIKLSLISKKLLLSFVLCCTVLSLVANPGNAFLYEFVDLMPPDWQESYATGINDNGDVVGWGIDDAGTQKGFIYRDGSYTGIPLPPGVAVSSAASSIDINVPFDINNRETVIFCGTDNHDQSYRSFIFRSGAYSEIILPGFNSAKALGINDSDVVVGSCRNTAGNEIGFMYDHGDFIELLPPGCDRASADAINDSGVAMINAAFLNTDEELYNYRSFIYSNGTYTELLPGLGGKSRYIRATAINNSGDIAGNGVENDCGCARSFVFSQGRAQLLPFAPLKPFLAAVDLVIWSYNHNISYSIFCGGYEVPADINEDEEILIQFGGAAYQYRWGIYTKLERYNLPACRDMISDPLWWFYCPFLTTNTKVNKINNSGEIAGYAAPYGEKTRAFIARPLLRIPNSN